MSNVWNLIIFKSTQFMIPYFCPEKNEKVFGKMNRFYEKGHKIHT